MAIPDIALDDRLLDERFSLLEQTRSWSPRVTSKLESFIRSAPDLDLFRVNPMQFGADRGVADAEALDLFLHATRAGLFEMDWHVVCPHCGFVIDSLHSMRQLRSHYLCPFCGADRDFDLDDYIQIAFTISPQIREIVYHNPESLSAEDLYYNYRLSRDVVSPIPAFPSWRDAIVHVTEFVGYAPPGDTVATGFEVTPGVVRVTDGKACLRLSVTHDERAEPSVIPLRLADGRFRSDDPTVQPRAMTATTMEGQGQLFRFELERELPSGRVQIELENADDRRRALWIYNTHELPPPVLQLRSGVSGKMLLTSQTFRDLFRSEVTDNSGEALSIRDVTYVFTDLKGSTTMYEQIGDAKALFLVHQHFDALGRVIRERSGAVVKTIGDAVMAVFDNSADATVAALEMIDALEEFNRTVSQELILKVGIHRGHSLAVTVNERVDFFGQNVNIAARVQALAGANEVYMTSDVYDSPGVGDALAANHVSSEEVRVRGVSEKLVVYRVAGR
jgi:class 3 adenylate cyclase